MTLIKSISGIRGTIGNKVGENLTPLDAVKFTSAYGFWLKQRNNHQKIKVVIGRDARISGKMISGLVSETLIGLGIDVLDLGLSTTPTVEVAVALEKAQGGIIITASHNPKQWNALKLLNEKGEFINGNDGEEVLKIADDESFEFAEVDDLGKFSKRTDYMEKHIEEVLKLKLVDVDAIKKAKFKVVVDAVNSTGGIAIPALLDKLGVEYIKLYCDPNGNFPHNPEPLPEHLTEISSLVVKENAHLGIVVDPDVDRLAIVCEDGSMFGEEYTLVACADYVLKNTPGNTVSNLSSSRALRDVTDKYHQKYNASAVGEVNVVAMMKATNAVIGGEGNGGIIYPESHYGRDSLVGLALFLSHLAHMKMSCRELRDSYPSYFMSKNKIELTPMVNVDKILSEVIKLYSSEEISTVDGVKIDFDTEWIHLRKSNTEPIIRIYTESNSQENADALANKIMYEIQEMSLKNIV
ncbi:MAG: phosphoglucosamine mutase [Flavobacteriaceae bacterium]|nr:phosphoglucosamine mutase [Flavobacteriaceae bacterium]